jgi:hypothetical protein
VIFLALIAAQLGVALTDSQAYQAQRGPVQVLADLDVVKIELVQNVSQEQPYDRRRHWRPDGH